MPWSALFLAVLLLLSHSARAQTLVRVGNCSRTITSGASPYAIATKLGWFARDGLKVELVPLPNDTDCTKLVATRDLAYAVPSIGPMVVMRSQGVKIKAFYTAYQGNIHGLAVMAASPIRTLQDLRGKRIGVIAIGGTDHMLARAYAVDGGLDPDHDIHVVSAGEGGQAAALLRQGAVDALAQFDTQFALVENTGLILRLVPTPVQSSYPSNAFIALEERLQTNRAEAVALTRDYARGTIYALTNPQAAIRATWEVFPQTRPLGKDEATAMQDETHVLEARARSWRLENAGVSRWGESNIANYQSYLDFLHSGGMLKDTPVAADAVTNELIEDINRFDEGEVVALAKTAR